MRVGGARLAAHDGALISVNGLTPNTAINRTATTTTAVRPLVSSTDADHDAVHPTRVVPNGRNTTTTTTTTYNNVRNQPPTRSGNDDGDRDGNTSGPSEGGFFSRAGRTLDHTTETVGDSLNRTGHAVNRTMRHTGTKIQRFFTGGGNDSNQSRQND